MIHVINILERIRDDSLLKICYIREHYREEFKNDAIKSEKDLVKELNDAILILEDNSNITE